MKIPNNGQHRDAQAFSKSIASHFRFRQLAPALALSLAFAAENIKSLPLALRARENFELDLQASLGDSQPERGAFFRVRELKSGLIRSAERTNRANSCFCVCEKVEKRFQFCDLFIIQRQSIYNILNQVKFNKMVHVTRTQSLFINFWGEKIGPCYAHTITKPLSPSSQLPPLASCCTYCSLLQIFVFQFCILAKKRKKNH